MLRSCIICGIELSAVIMRLLVSLIAGLRVEFESCSALLNQAASQVPGGIELLSSLGVMRSIKVLFYFGGP